MEEMEVLDGIRDRTSARETLPVCYHVSLAEEIASLSYRRSEWNAGVVGRLFHVMIDCRLRLNLNKRVLMEIKELTLLLKSLRL